MKLVSASFFWRNDKPGGLGLTFRTPGFSSAELTVMFKGPNVAEYFKASDEALGSGIVVTYFEQLQALAAEAKRHPLPLEKAILAALNIMWLTERGFLANDEFNGMLFVEAE